MPVDLFEIAERFRGPPRSGNGGYTCGLIARRLPGPLTIRLKAPPPINSALQLDYSTDAARLRHGDTLVADARRASLDLVAPPSPTFAAATEASRSYPGFDKHNFPGCFVCGPAREPGDGLRIFPGPAGEGGLLAAPWTPDPSLADESATINTEFLWSALDCTGAFAVLPARDGVAIVLGEFSAHLVGEIRPHDNCVVTGWPLAIDGRKRTAGSAVFGPDGRTVAVARAVWIEVPLADWN